MTTKQQLQNKLRQLEYKRLQLAKFSPTNPHGRFSPEYRKTVLEIDQVNRQLKKL